MSVSRSIIGSDAWLRIHARAIVSALVRKTALAVLGLALGAGTSLAAARAASDASGADGRDLKAEFERFLREKGATAGAGALHEGTLTTDGVRLTPELRARFEQFLAEQRAREQEAALRREIARFFYQNPYALDEKAGEREKRGRNAEMAAADTSEPSHATEPWSRGVTGGGTIDGDRAAVEGARKHAALQTKVRDAGYGKETDLRKKMKGPAYQATTSTFEGSAVSFQAGATKRSGDDRKYTYTGASQSVLGFEAKLGFIGDDQGNAAGELQITKKIDDASVNFTTMRNGHFESEQTGFGSRVARSYNQVGVDWYLGGSLLGVAMRDATRYSGTEIRDLRTYQVLSLGPLYLSNAMVTPLGPEMTALGGYGTLSLSGDAGSVGFSADLDYGDGTRLAPTAITLSIEATDLGPWELKADVSHAFDRSYSGVDLRLVRESGGLRFGPIAGWDNFTGAYFLFRAWLPLSSGARPYNWLMEGERARTRQDVVQDEWCRTTAACR